MNPIKPSRAASLEATCAAGRTNDLIVLKVINTLEYLPSDKITREQLKRLIDNGVNVVITKRKW